MSLRRPSSPTISSISFHEWATKMGQDKVGIKKLGLLMRLSHKNDRDREEESRGSHDEGGEMVAKTKINSHIPSFMTPISLMKRSPQK